MRAAYLSSFVHDYTLDCSDIKPNLTSLPHDITVPIQYTWMYRILWNSMLSYLENKQLQ